MNPEIWSPTYVIDRIRLFLYEKTHRKEPWIPSKAVKALQTLLTEEMMGLEYGSGRSTQWYAHRLKHLISVEDNREWYLNVKKQLETNNVDNVSYEFKSSVIDKNGIVEYKDYIELFEDSSLDFVVVDGKFRAEIALIAHLKLRSGGILLLDDSERYLAYRSKAPYSIGNDFSSMTENWQIFYKAIEHWDISIYSNGVTDTMISIKP